MGTKLDHSTTQRAKCRGEYFDLRKKKYKKKKLRKFHNEERHQLYSSHRLLGRMRQLRHRINTKEIRNGFKSLVRQNTSRDDPVVTILKRVLEKQDMRVWAGYTFLRTGCNDGILRKLVHDLDS
jgi:uncharacterized membrane protein YgaE (UPF0421/DUF939 family)